MRFWWVNQNQTFRQEQSGGYLWSPKRKSNGHRNRFYDTMREVKPSDLVLSFQNTRLQSIGAVHSYCYESPKPLEFGSAGSNWEAIGWRVDVHWSKLTNAIRPSEHIGVLRATLPIRYSPIRAENGHGLQSVYLAEIPGAMMNVLAGLIGYEARILMDASSLPKPGQVGERNQDAEDLKSKWENHLENRIQNDKTIVNTERIALVRARRGQGVFRDNVRHIEQCCRVTKVDNSEHLIASHCKPWRHASNDERLDGENGLLLTPSVDHLFDRGFISFEDTGRLIISPVADTESLRRMGIDNSTEINVGSFSSGQRNFLDYHRNEILLEIR